MPIPSTDLNQFFAPSVNNIVMVHQMLWVEFEVYKNLIFLAEAFTSDLNIRFPVLARKVSGNEQRQHNGKLNKKESSKM